MGIERLQEKNYILQCFVKVGTWAEGSHSRKHPKGEAGRVRKALLVFGATRRLSACTLGQLLQGPWKLGLLQAGAL